MRRKDNYEYIVTTETTVKNIIKNYKKKFDENELPSLKEEDEILDLSTSVSQELLTKDGLKEKFGNENLLNINKMLDGKCEVLETMPVTLIGKFGEERVVYKNRLSIMTPEKCQEKFGDVKKIEKLGKSNENQTLLSL